MGGGKTKSKASKTTKTTKANKRTKKKVSSVATSSAVKVAATAPVVPVVPVASSTHAPDDFSLEAMWSDHTANLTNLWKMAKQCSVNNRKLHRVVKLHLKDAKKRGRNRRRVHKPISTKREPSGFACPAKISDELCDFLGKPYGTEMARTEVTKYMTTYIKDNNLQNPSNKRQIVPDDKLLSLLNVPDSEALTYFNLQKFLKEHFVKSQNAVVTATTS